MGFKFGQKIIDILRGKELKKSLAEYDFNIADSINNLSIGLLIIDFNFCNVPYKIRHECQF